MTGIIKTDQLQGAQSSTITIPSGNKISIIDSATIGTLNAATMRGVTTFADSSVFSGTTNFTGTMTGGGMDLLLSVENNSSSPDPSPTYYDIDSTYINSTYDNYYLVGYFEGNADTRYLQGRVFVGGVVQSGNVYGDHKSSIGSSSDGGGDTETHLFTASMTGMGGDDGEGTNVSMTFQNANNTMAPFCVTGMSNYHNNSAGHVGAAFTGSFIPANRASVVNGIRLKMHSGDLTNFKFRLYGLKD